MLRQSTTAAQSHGIAPWATTSRPTATSTTPKAPPSTLASMLALQDSMVPSTTSPHYLAVGSVLPAIIAIMKPPSRHFRVLLGLPLEVSGPGISTTATRALRGQFQNMYAPHHQSPQSNRFAMVELMPRLPCWYLMPQFCTYAMRLHPCSILKTSCSVLAGPLRHPARHALRAPTPTSLAALHASPVRHTATALSLRQDRSLSRFATVQRAPSRIKWACTPQASVVRALPVAGAAWAAASIAQPIRMPT